jgi:hypothetical protein
MKIVMFENPNAIFDFDLPDVIDRLKYYSDQNVREATEILDAISSCPSPTVEVTSDYFGYMVLNLIKADKGHAYCKVCKETYDPSQLRSRPLGLGKSPFSINLEVKRGTIKKLFGKKQRITGRGGEAYDCPNGHELIGMITWIS